MHRIEACMLVEGGRVGGEVEEKAGEERRAAEAFCTTAGRCWEKEGLGRGRARWQPCNAYHVTIVCDRQRRQRAVCRRVLSVRPKMAM